MSLVREIERSSKLGAQIPDGTEIAASAHRQQSRCKMPRVQQSVNFAAQVVTLRLHACWRILPQRLHKALFGLYQAPIKCITRRRGLNDFSRKIQIRRLQGSAYGGQELVAMRRRHLGCPPV
jgi:hypothetical protein